ncbi:MAG: lipooligosaccharide transport system permease protein [Bradymonadia bacterium]|jgi:lipooligosaccharide transport system permease protein
MRLPGDIDVAMAMAVWRRNLTLYRRTWVMNILPNFFEPLLYLVGMGVGLGAYLGEEVGGMSYLAFIAPGLMAAAAMNGAVFETTYNVFIKMNYQRIYDAYLGTPAQIQDIMFGELLWATTRAAIYGCAFLVVVAALSFGAGMNMITSWWALLIPVAVLGTGMLFAAIGAAFTSMIKVIDLFSYFYTLFLTPLFLFSGIFFPVSRFAYGEQIAFFTPLYHAVRVIRSLAHGTVDASTGISVVWILAVTMLLYAIIPGRMRKTLAR